MARRRILALVAAMASAAVALAVSQPRPVAAATHEIGPPAIRVAVSAANAPPITFEGCGPDGCSRFTLDSDPNTPTPPQMVARSLAAGTYTIRQLDMPNWFLTTIDCERWPLATLSIPDRTATVTVGQYSGEVSCRFFLSTQSLTIEQDVRTNDPVDLHFTGCNEAGCSTFALDDDYRDDTLPNSITAQPIPPGTYTVTQDPDAAWPLTDLSCAGTHAVDLARRRATITIAPTRGATCTFQNRTQSLSVTAYTPGIGYAHTFAFEGCQGTGCAPFTLDGGMSLWTAGKITAPNIVPGTYTIRQSQEAEWPLSAITCSGASSTDVDLAARTVNVTVGPGVDVNCQFQNTSQGIEITQDTQPDSAQDFAFTSCRDTHCGAFVLDDDADPALDRVRRSGPVAPGTYTITQDEVTDHELVDLTCQNARVNRAARRATVTLTAGVWARCTFVDAPAPSPEDPNLAPPLTGVAQISAGFYRTCAVVDGGQVRCWGDPTLGDGSQASATTPTLVSNPEGTGPLTGAVEVAVGSASACALLQDGRVVCWGSNFQGQLGNGTTIDALRPTFVSNPEGTGPLEDVAGISLGFATACARLADGEVRCWGYNQDGRLGNGTMHSNATRPVVVLDESGTGPLQGVTTIAVSLNHTCAVLTNGQARCWGEGSHGELGQGSGADSLRPVPVTDIDASGPLTDVVAIATRWDHTCARLGSGEARCWGPWGALGVEGNPPTGVPVAVASPSGTGPLTDIASVAAGGFSSCAATVVGATLCWGSNANGELGDGTRVDSDLPVTVLEAATGAPLDEAVQVVTGYDHACAVLRSGQARCWGDNGSGQLGDGTQADRTRAVTVALPATP